MCQRFTAGAAVVVLLVLSGAAHALPRGAAAAPAAGNGAGVWAVAAPSSGWAWSRQPAQQQPAQQQPAQQQPAQQQPLPTAYPEIRKLYEAGKYAQVIQAVAAVQQPGPPLQFLAGLTHEKLQQPVRANERYARLTANKPETDPWRFIGQSATLLNQTPKKIDEAIGAARRAVTLAPQNPHAHYQLGHALGNKRDYAGAAQAFEKATELDPAHAYAHYHAGLSYYQVRRVDQVARHFEAFLRLAPEAPERGQVMSIMRTIRG